jgi:hypothetical protein
MSTTGRRAESRGEARRRAASARWRVPRSRGATAGTLLVALGLWGALIPFIGPYFDYGFGPDTTWTWSAAKFWLEVLPGIATIVGGLLLMRSTTRVLAAAGGWLASVAGAWFIIGPSISALWNPGTLGRPMGGPKTGAAEWIGMFYGLGSVILFLGAAALGRLSVVGLRDARAADARAGAADARAGAGGPVTGPDGTTGAPGPTGTPGAGTLGGWRSGGFHRRGRHAPDASASGPDAAPSSTRGPSGGGGWPGDESEPPGGAR